MLLSAIRVLISVEVRKGVIIHQEVWMMALDGEIVLNENDEAVCVSNNYADVEREIASLNRLMERDLDQA